MAQAERRSINDTVHVAARMKWSDTRVQRKRLMQETGSFATKNPFFGGLPVFSGHRPGVAD
ncbi:MAG: hypothetical protein V3W34_00125 [Phycisphaerae bacterium]